jgi:tripartite-type tricarboxylate transporter receptor subunit TctC
MKKHLSSIGLARLLPLALYLGLICPQLFFSPLLFAQNYPSKPIRLIIPQPPGGTSDILGRALAVKLTDTWHQPVVVDNRTGASGTIGTDLAAKAPPDGYTLLLIYTTHTTTPSLFGKLPYDPVNDFSPITLATSAPLLLTVHPQVNTKTVKEFIQLANSKGGQLNFGSAGNGSGSHLAGELFKTLSGAPLTHVPYKGSAPAIIDLLSGQVQAMFAGIVPIDPHVKSARLRGIAVSSLKRAAAAPQYPPIADTLPGFEVVGWYGLMAPAKTPPSIINQLNHVLRIALQSKDLSERLSKEGAEVVANSPAEFTAFLKEDIARWAKVIKRAGAKVD